MKLAELAVRFGCELRGDPDIDVIAVAPLASAGAGAISFLANPRYRSQLLQTRAAAVIVDAAGAEDCPVPALVTQHPHACFARVAALLHPEPVAAPGCHPSAVVAADAVVDPSAHIGPQCVIGAGARIGERAVIGPACIIEPGAELGADVQLVARVTVCRGVSLGARCVVQPGAVLGADGFGYAPEHGRWVKVPQLGSVRIGADVEIGANTTIDRGAMGDTVIGEGVKLDNQIQIGHNVVIGAHTAMAACVGVSGSTKIGQRCQIGGAVGIVGHLTICDDVVVTGFTMVSSSIATPGVYSSGLPASGAAEWRRIVGRLRRIDAMANRLRAVERRLGGPGTTDDDL
ncbi:MAG: UDP-3-O-(3-hydroxymyristoyl)glucosamine N-acyltransferase [Steroidobacteraceae bacterium]